MMRVALARVGRAGGPAPRTPRWEAAASQTRGFDGVG